MRVRQLERVAAVFGRSLHRAVIAGCAAMLLLPACGGGGEGEAHAPAPGCQSHDDCAGGQACVGSACIVGCRADGDCGAGEICDNAVCEPGCRNPADCPPFSTCRNSVCVEAECSANADCGAGSRCGREGCEEVGDAVCEADEDCGHRWACSATGRCIDGECAVAADCADDHRCVDGVCAERRRFLGMPSFSRIDVPVIDAHVSAWPSLDCCGCVLCDTVEGFGGALYDADGDKDLDLFLGANDGPGASAPCTYLNESEGAHAFSRSDCRDAAAGASTALGVDFDGDGVHELLTLGQRHAVLHLDEPIDLLEILPERDARRDCSAGAAAVVDLDLDGALDIYVGCQPQRLSPCCDDDSETWRNFALRQSGSGQFEQLRGEDWQLLEDTGVTLAIAIYDLNQDGLLDILLANDTFTMLGDPPNGFRPGGALLRCAPGEDCEYRRVEFGVGSDAWGSFMGVGIVEVDGEGPHVYLSDWGQNRLVKFGDDGPENSALDRGADLTAIEGAVLFGWGVVVDDFDRNGLDDIYVAQGAPWPGPPEEEVDQHDELLMQVAGGTFERLKAEEVGLVLHGPEDARSPESDIGVQRYSSRGSVRVDLDADGRMEFLTGALAGIVRVQEEDEAPDETPRCTVIPRPSVVPTMGTGYAVSGLAEGSGFRHYDIQGQMQFGASPWLLTRYTSGRVRFPSGAILPFDCDGGPGPVEVVEPEWLTVVWGDDVEVSIDRPGAPATTVRFAGRLRSGSVRFFEPEGADGVYTASVGGATQAVMVELDGKWVGRWFARP